MCWGVLGNVDVYNLRLLNMDEKVVEVSDQSIDDSSDEDEEGSGSGKYEYVPMGQELAFAEDTKRKECFVAEQQNKVAETEVEDGRLREALRLLGEQVQKQ